MAPPANVWKARVLFAVAAIALLAATAGAAAAQDVGPGEAFAIIRENAGNGDFVILDVRTPGEYAEGRLKGAVLIDYLSPTFREGVEKLDRGKTYLVYCRTGNRSSRALEILKDLGFRSYYHMAGGIVRWSAEGLPTVR